jgi:hypothetical protein
VTLVASGDVSDYTPSVRDAIVASFASRAAVSPSAISLTITSASVRIVVSIASTLRSTAEALGARLAPILASASSASALLPAGFNVTQTPIIEVTETGGGGGGADSDMGAIIGGAVGGGALVLVCVIFMASSRAKIRDLVISMLRPKIRDVVITAPVPKRRQRQSLAHIRSARNKQIAGTLTDRLDRISNGEAEDDLDEVDIEMTEIKMTGMPAPLAVAAAEAAAAEAAEAAAAEAAAAEAAEAAAAEAAEAAAAEAAAAEAAAEAAAAEAAAAEAAAAAAAEAAAEAAAAEAAAAEAAAAEAAAEEEAEAAAAEAAAAEAAAAEAAAAGFQLELLDVDEHTVLCTLPLPVGAPTEIGRDSLGLSDFKRISRTQLIITANGGDGCTIQRAGIHPSYCTPSTGASPQAIERGSSVDVALGSILYMSHLKERGFLFPFRVVQVPFNIP